MTTKLYAAGVERFKHMIELKPKHTRCDYSLMGIRLLTLLNFSFLHPIRCMETSEAVSNVQSCSQCGAS